MSDTLFTESTRDVWDVNEVVEARPDMWGEVRRAQPCVFVPSFNEFWIATSEWFSDLRRASLQ